MAAKLLPEEIICCILKIGDIKEISFKSSDIHKCIYRLKKDPEFSHLLKSFRFSGSPVAPYSEVLDNALFNLQFGDKLKRQNPEMTTYSLSENFDEYYEKNIKPKLDSNIIDQFDKLAVKVKSLLYA